MQTILLVDDQDINLSYLNSVLTRFKGINFESFISPLEALEWCTNNSPSLVILDYRMPEINGVELTQRIRTYDHLAHVPILMVTGDTDGQVFYQAMEAGVNDFLLRPFERGEFTARVKNLLTIDKLYASLLEKIPTLPEDRPSNEIRLSKLEESNTRYELALGGNYDGLWDWDIIKGSVYYSKSWAEMIGYTREEISPIPASWFNRVHPGDLRRFSSTVDNHLNSSNSEFHCEYRMKQRNGEYVWMLARGTCVRDRTGKALRLVGLQTNISDLKTIQEELTHSAFHDILTGLANRALFIERLNQAFVRFKRNPDQRFALLFIDLDKFKKVNDTYGHAFGDELLKAITPRLLACTRELDTVARLGGDEFTILLSDVSTEDEVKSYLERIQTEIGKELNIDGIETHPTLSIGVALVNEEYLSVETLMHDADLALYQAKEEGRDRYVFFESDMRKGSSKIVEIKSTIHQATEKNEMEMYFQPIVDLKSQSIKGFEALMRWHHPQYGFISPDDFIQIAEESELILTLGDFAIEKSLLQLKKWMILDVIDGLFMSINISKRQILQQNFIDKIVSAVKNAGLHNSDVMLELNEKSFSEAYQHNESLFSNLRALGFKLSIDDYGSGQTSLLTLAKYPLDYIKIDREITLNVLKDPASRKVFDIITEICAERRLSTIVEGIETQEIYQAILQSNNTMAQGYLFAAPGDVEHITKLLRKSA